MRFGKIPSRLHFVSAAPVKFKCGWEDINVSIAEDVSVVPCFAADADSADNIRQGRKWATDFNTSSRVALDDTIEAVEDNLPRTLTVIGLEKRMEGGRSFKVMDSARRLFDLREDVLLETLMSVGATAGGVLNGQFIFAKVGSQMRLIRVDSALHAEMLKSENRRQSKNVASEELVIGGVYANRRGLLIYLGRVDTVEVIGTYAHSPVPFTAAGASEQKKLRAAGIGVQVKELSVTGEHLSIPIARYRQAEPERELENALRNPTSAHMFQFGKTITAVELVSRIEVPANIIERLRLRAVERIDENIAGRKSPKYVDGFGEEAVTLMNLAGTQEASAMLNLRVHGSGANQSAEYKDLLKRSKV